MFGQLDPVMSNDTIYPTATPPSPHKAHVPSNGQPAGCGRSSRLVFFDAPPQPPHPAALHSHRQMVPKVPPAAPISPVSDTSILLQRHTQPQQARSAGGEASRVSKVLVRRWERLEPSVWSPAPSVWRSAPRCSYVVCFASWWWARRSAAGGAEAA